MLVPVEGLERVVTETRGHIAALETYRRQLTDQQRQADLWATQMAGIIEALIALQDKIAGGSPWNDKRIPAGLTSNEGDVYLSADGRRH